MKKPINYLVAILLLSGCSSAKTEEFVTKSQDQIENELTSFIESYNWQNGSDKQWPLISVTSEEIERLKSAWRSTGQEHDVLANRFARTDKAISDTLIFPPEGGQHNQWYQCSDCQIALVTVDAHNHKCPECDKIYSGFPFDNVLYSRQHSRNFSVAEDAAWAWALTGEKKYAEFAGKVLKGYAERYLNYPMVHAQVNDKNINVASEKIGKYSSAGHIAEQTLNEAGLMIPLVTAYDLIYDSGILSSEERKKIEDDLIRAMADCINVHKTGKSNWQTWHNAALLYAGTVLGDKQMVQQAMLDPENGFIKQMNISVTPEGMWYENSWGYHYYTLNALTLIAEGCRRLGMDIYSHEMLYKMYFIAFDYLMSDGTLPRFGDAVNDTPDNKDINEMAYAVYKDDRLLSTLGQEPTWDNIVSGRDLSKTAAKPLPSSKLIPGSGHAVLATDGPGSLTAALSFGPYGGFHGHFDKLSFVFFGYGQELGVDPGRAASQAYRLPVHGAWYKATTGHNTVLVDGKSQKEATGKLLAFSTGNSYSAVSADAGPAFESVNHKRFLLLAPSYLLVFDQLEASDNAIHQFDWLYHNTGTSVDCNLKTSDKKTGDSPDGYSYLRDIISYYSSEDEPLRISFNGDEVITRLEMKGQKGDEVFTATGPFSSVNDRVPVVIVRRRGQKVNYISALEPVKKGEKPDVNSIEIVNEDPVTLRILRSACEDLVMFENNEMTGFRVIHKTGTGEKTVIESLTKGSI
jgi:hypothetical protein